MNYRQSPLLNDFKVKTTTKVITNMLAGHNKLMLCLLETIFGGVNLVGLYLLNMHWRKVPQFRVDTDWIRNVFQLSCLMSSKKRCGGKGTIEARELWNNLFFTILWCTFCVIYHVITVFFDKTANFIFFLIERNQFCIRQVNIIFVS